jgi:hypothetical protein
MKSGILVEHRDVLQNEVTKEQIQRQKADVWRRVPCRRNLQIIVETSIVIFNASAHVETLQVSGVHLDTVLGKVGRRSATSI